jgi:hypothetical protein
MTRRTEENHVTSKVWPVFDCCIHTWATKRVNESSRSASLWIMRATKCCMNLNRIWNTNIGMPPLHYTVSQPRRHRLESSRLWKPQISHQGLKSFIHCTWKLHSQLHEKNTTSRFRRSLCNVQNKKHLYVSFVSLYLSARVFRFYNLFVEVNSSLCLSFVPWRHMGEWSKVPCIDNLNTRRR